MEEQTLQWTRESGKQIYIKWKNRHYNGQGNLGNRFILNGRTDITMDKGIWETDLYKMEEQTLQWTRESGKQIYIGVVFYPIN